MLKRCLIIGLGQIGMGYDYHNEKDILTHAHAISSHHNFELVGGVDFSQNRRDLFSKKYKKPVFSDIILALKVIDADIIIIATPAETHLEIIRIILRNTNPEAILCEKPLANNINDSNTIVDICNSSNTTLYTNFIRRSEPGVIAVRDKIINQQIETPIKGVCWYSKGLHNNGSHFINLSALWLGKFNGSKLLSIRDVSLIDPEPDFLINFEKGSVVFRSLQDDNFNYYGAEFFSKSGRLLYERGGEKITWQSSISGPNRTNNRILNSEYEIIPSDLNRYQWHVYDQIHRHYSGRKCDISIGIDALETAFAIEDIRRQF